MPLEELQDLQEQMSTLGATAEDIAAHTAHLVTDEHFEIYAANWPVLEWFCDVEDLFVFENKVCLGLDVNAIQADANLSSREVNAGHYRALRYLGRQAAVELNKKRDSR